MSFENKVVLITGGSSGIGAATAVFFSKEGASVTIIGRNETGLQTVTKQCEDVGKKALYIQADITNDDKLKEIVKTVIDTYGKLDILVNNAGITSNANILKGNLLEEYDKVMNVNLRAVIHLTTLAAPELIKTKGNIINVSSISGLSYFRRSTVMPYAISKAGLDHFTRGAALELLKYGVRVNSVSPGLTKTNILSNCGINTSWEDARVAYNLERVSEPEEVADMIGYLASDKARGITGVNYVIDNGCMLKG